MRRGFCLVRTCYETWQTQDHDSICSRSGPIRAVTLSGMSQPRAGDPGKAFSSSRVKLTALLTIRIPVWDQGSPLEFKSEVWQLPYHPFGFVLEAPGVPGRGEQAFDEQIPIVTVYPLQCVRFAAGPGQCAQVSCDLSYSSSSRAFPLGHCRPHPWLAAAYYHCVGMCMSVYFLLNNNIGRETTQHLGISNTLTRLHAPIPFPVRHGDEEDL